VAAYLIVEIEVRDRVGYEDYKRAAEESVRSHGGRYLARGGRVEVLEGEWPARRLVLLEFPGTEAAKAWWSSEAYREARAIRLRTADARMLLVEGL
jgi:uncharacterized protein (DUF1330 family)